MVSVIETDALVVFRFLLTSSAIDNTRAISDSLSSALRALQAGLGRHLYYSGKSLGLYIELPSDGWSMREEESVALLLSWAKDRIHLLEIVVPESSSGDSNLLPLEADSRIRNMSLPALESFTWTGMLEYHIRSPFTGLSFGQLTTLRLQCDRDLALDDCIELLSRCSQIVTFSNFEPDDPLSALAQQHPPRSAFLQHTQRQAQIHRPSLTSLSLSSDVVMPLFERFVFLQLAQLRIRVTAVGTQRLHNLDIEWSQLSEVFIFADLAPDSSHEIVAKCEDKAIQHHQRLNGSIIQSVGV